MNGYDCMQDGPVGIRCRTGSNHLMLLSQWLCYLCLLVSLYKKTSLMWTV